MISSKKCQGHGVPVLPVFVDFLQHCLANDAKIMVSVPGSPPLDYHSFEIHTGPRRWEAQSLTCHETVRTETQYAIKQSL